MVRMQFTLYLFSDTRFQCWGGTFLSRNFLGLPQPVVYLIPPYINYVTVHLVLTLVFDVFPTLLNPKLFDTVLFPIDAVVRVAAITSTVAFLSMPSPAGTSVHPALTLSPLTHMVIGALSSNGGGITASTLSTWSPSWSFSTPPILRAGTGLWGSVDFWGGAVVAVIYGTATGHEAFSDVTAVLSQMRLVSMDGAKMESLEARALAAAVLSVLFGIRAWKVHWAASVVPSDWKPAAKSKAQ